MVYDSPYGQFPTCTVPVHQLVIEKIDEVCGTEPHRKAFISAADPNKFMTFTQLKEQIFSVAQFLHERDFVKQIACTVTSNCLEYLPFFFGVSLQGGALSGSSALFTEYELRSQFEDCECSVVLCDETNLEKTRNAAKGLAAIKTIIVISDTSSDDYFTWNDVIATRADHGRVFPSINVEEDIAILPYSSGTTGPPKGVILTHSNLGTIINVFKWLRTRFLQATGGDPDAPGATQLHVQPVYHIFGFVVTLTCTIYKCTAVVLSKFEPDLFCRTLEDYKISSIAIAPPILVFLAKDPRCDNYDLTSLKSITFAAAPVRKSLMDEVRQRYPSLQKLQQGYGMTEMSTSSHLPDANSARKFGCCGKLLPGLQMKIIDPSTGEELPQGESGEICLRGPTLMKGYLRKEKETQEAIRDGWMHTGDIGYMDVEGDLFVVDRLKELIKVNGLQVAPAELESVLLTHPSIVDAAVIGIKDEITGEAPKAFIVRKDDTLTEELVADFLKDKVAPYKYLSGGVEFIDAIPKSEAGKILRRQLRDRE